MEEDNCNIQLESLPILVTSDISYCNSMISFQKSVKNGSQMILKISTLSILALVNEIVQGNLCFVKLLNVIFHYQIYFLVFFGKFFSKM